MTSPSEYNIILTDGSYYNDKWGASAVLFSSNTEILDVFNLGGYINVYKLNQVYYIMFAELMGIYCAVRVLCNNHMHFNKTCVIITDNKQVFDMLHYDDYDSSGFNDVFNVVLYKLLMTMVTVKLQVKIVFKHKINDEVLCHVLRATKSPKLLQYIKSHEWPPHGYATYARKNCNYSMYNVMEFNDVYKYNISKNTFVMSRRDFLKISYKYLIKTDMLFKLIQHEFNNKINYDINSSYLYMVEWIYVYDDDVKWSFWYNMNIGSIILLDYENHSTCLNDDWFCYKKDKIKIWHNTTTSEWFYVIQDDHTRSIGYTPYHINHEEPMNSIINETHIKYHDGNGKELLHCNNGRWCVNCYQ